MLNTQDLERYIAHVRTHTALYFPDATDEEIQALIRNGYSRYRAQAYPAIGDQLDMQYHNPDLWRETIEAVKAAFPKPIPGDDELIARFRGKWKPKITILNAPETVEEE